jgi:transposase
MRGTDARSGELFSYVDLEKRVPTKHPLRLVRGVVNDVLAALDGDFSRAYADSSRPSIPPERLLRALLLQAFYTIRPEQHYMRGPGPKHRAKAVASKGCGSVEICRG